MTVCRTVGTAASYTLPAVGGFIPSLMLHHRSVRVHEQCQHAASRWPHGELGCGQNSVSGPACDVMFLLLLLMGTLTSASGNLLAELVRFGKKINKSWSHWLLVSLLHI